jgi:nitrite reductase/ring-hydroxylating ferredoxin subunit
VDAVICASDRLAEGGRGVRFAVEQNGERLAAFAVRYRGAVHAYVNRCAHRGVELDWNPGEFFDGEGYELVCATHDARYAPDTGLCTAGPCAGGCLLKLPVRECDRRVTLIEGDGLHLAKSAD